MVFTGIAISPGGQRVAVGLRDGTIHVFQLLEGTRTAPAGHVTCPKEGAILPVEILYWTTDQRLIASYSNGLIALYEVKAGNITRLRMRRLDNPLTSLVAAGDDVLFGIDARGQAMHLRRLVPVDSELPSVARAVLFDRHGKFLVIVGSETHVFSTEAGSLRAVRVIPDCVAAVMSSEGVFTGLRRNGEIFEHRLDSGEERALNERGTCGTEPTLRWLGPWKSLLVHSRDQPPRVLWPRDPEVGCLRFVQLLADGTIWDSTEDLAVTATGAAPPDRLFVWRRGEAEPQNLYIARNPAMKQSTILHISDLHFRSAADAHMTLDRLRQSLLNDGIRDIDYIVISGDVADRCGPEGYKAAVQFVKDLALYARIALTDMGRRVLVVPGNHDVDYEQSSRAFAYIGKGLKAPAAADVPCPPHGGLDRIPKEYQKRLKKFSDCFYNPVFGVDYPLNPEQQWKAINSGYDPLLIVGLNSASPTDHIAETRAALDELALAEAIKHWNQFLNDNADAALIVVFHHPMSGERAIPPRNVEFLGGRPRLLCVLHGDSHRPRVHPQSPQFGAAPPVVDAGYAGRDPEQLSRGILWSYNYVTVDWGEKTAKVQSRWRLEENGPWMPAKKFGTDPGQLSDTTLVATFK